MQTEAYFFNIHAYIALRSLVSLFGCLAAWAGRIAVTDRETEKETHTQTNPHCTCTPRVNKTIANHENVFNSTDDGD